MDKVAYYWHQGRVSCPPPLLRIIRAVHSPLCQLRDKFQANRSWFFLLSARWICWSSCKVFRSQAINKQKEIPSSSHFFGKKVGLWNTQDFPSVTPFVVGRLCFNFISPLSHSYRQHHPLALICQPVTSVTMSACFVTIIPVVMLRLWS